MVAHIQIAQLCPLLPHPRCPCQQSAHYGQAGLWLFVFFMFPHGLLSHPINRGFPLGTATPDKGAFANNAGSW